VLHHPQREEILPLVQTELPVLQFVPIAPCPVTGHHCPCGACAERMKFLGPLIDVLKSGEIDKVYYEYGAKEGFESLAAVLSICWSSAPLGFCRTWRGSNERA